MKSNSLKESNEFKEQSLIKWMRQDLKRTEIFVGLPFAKRFLRARKYDMVKSQKMVKNYFQFRDKMMKKMEYFSANNSKSH